MMWQMCFRYIAMESLLQNKFTLVFCTDCMTQKNHLRYFIFFVLLPDKIYLLFISFYKEI
jgi:hypothetical protein